jgi:hypothetical protein
MAHAASLRCDALGRFRGFILPAATDGGAQGRRGIAP